MVHSTVWMLPHPTGVSPKPIPCAPLTALPSLLLSSIIEGLPKSWDLNIPGMPGVS